MNPLAILGLFCIFLAGFMLGYIVGGRNCDRWWLKEIERGIDDPNLIDKYSTDSWKSFRDGPE